MYPSFRIPTNCLCMSLIPACFFKQRRCLPNSLWRCIELHQTYFNPIRSNKAGSLSTTPTLFIPLSWKWQLVDQTNSPEGTLGLVLYNLHRLANGLACLVLIWVHIYDELLNHGYSTYFDRTAGFERRLTTRCVYAVGELNTNAFAFR